MRMKLIKTHGIHEPDHHHQQTDRLRASEKILINEKSLFFKTLRQQLSKNKSIAEH
jgi:hypothetical protein